MVRYEPLPPGCGNFYNMGARCVLHLTSRVSSFLDQADTLNEVNTLSPSSANATLSSSLASQSASITQWGIKGDMTVSSGTQTPDKPVIPAAMITPATSTKTIATSTSNPLQRVPIAPTSGVIRPPPDDDDEEDTGPSVVGLVGGLRRRDRLRWQSRRQNDATAGVGAEEDTITLGDGVNASEAIMESEEPRIDRLA
jgi:hypothetical protein